MSMLVGVRLTLAEAAAARTYAAGLDPPRTLPALIREALAQHLTALGYPPVSGGPLP
jgi:hypothetical protein